MGKTCIHILDFLKAKKIIFKKSMIVLTKNMFLTMHKISTYKHACIDPRGIYLSIYLSIVVRKIYSSGFNMPLLALSRKFCSALIRRSITPISSSGLEETSRLEEAPLALLGPDLRPSEESMLSLSFPFEALRLNSDMFPAFKDSRRLLMEDDKSLL